MKLRTTVMRLVVNVPVLSEQIVVALPIVSQAYRCLTRLLSDIILYQPHTYNQSINQSISQYRVGQKSEPQMNDAEFRQILADFRNSFTVTISRKFAMQQSLNIPPHYLRRHACGADPCCYGNEI